MWLLNFFNYVAHVIILVNDTTLHIKWKSIVLTNNKTKKKGQVIFFYTAVYFTLIAVESLLNDEEGEEELPSPGMLLMLIPALRTLMQKEWKF